MGLKRRVEEIEEALGGTHCAVIRTTLLGWEEGQRLLDPNKIERLARRVSQIMDFLGLEEVKQPTPILRKKGKRKL